MSTEEIKVNDPKTLGGDAPGVTPLSKIEQLKRELEQEQAKQKQDRESYKELVAETLPQAIEKLINVSAELSEAKKYIYQYFEELLKLKIQVYGVKDNQRSHTFSTPDAEITIGYRITDGWDDTVGSGIAKVTQFINSLAKDENSAALVETVFNLLKKDAKGNLKGSRVLELQKLTQKFNDAEFTDGVGIISEAYKPVYSCWFIDASTIKNGNKHNIPLSMSSVDFPAGYEFNFEDESRSNT